VVIKGELSIFNLGEIEQIVNEGKEDIARILYHLCETERERVKQSKNRKNRLRERREKRSRRGRAAGKKEREGEKNEKEMMR